jgi:hypothetical protein
MSPPPGDTKSYELNSPPRVTPRSSPKSSRENARHSNNLIFYTCFYIAAKYRNILVNLPEIGRIITRPTEHDFNFIKEFEEFLIIEVLGYRIYRPTIYNFIHKAKFLMDENMVQLLIKLLKETEPRNEEYDVFYKYLTNIIIENCK